MEEAIKLISFVVTYYPKDLAKMLNEDGVVVDATNFTTKELSEATLTGLTSSKKFNDDFVAFVKKIAENTGYSNVEGFGANYGGIISAGIPALTTLFMSNTNTKNLQAQLNAQNEANQTQLQLADKQLEIARLQAQGGLNQQTAKGSGNTMLYVALGVGGVLVLGIVIFAVTRK
jgi:hypothetical protein